MFIELERLAPMLALCGLIGYAIGYVWACIDASASNSLPPGKDGSARLDARE